MREAARPQREREPPLKRRELLLNRREGRAGGLAVDDVAGQPIRSGGVPKAVTKSRSVSFPELFSCAREVLEMASYLTI